MVRRKARLTITLTPDLLRQVDGMVDREAVQNRSHAIEMLLRQALRPTIDSAVILAGGPSTGSGVPALAPIDGRPLISVILKHLLSHGVRSFVILPGKQDRQLRDLLGDGSSMGAEIRFVREEEPLGTAGALGAATPHLHSKPFLVVHGDVLTDMDISSFIDFHLNEGTLATIAVKPRHSERSYGKVILQGNRITSFLERSGGEGISIINTGVYLFQPEILSLIEEEKLSRLETDVFPHLARMGELSAFFFQGIWFDISSPENYRVAETRWRQKGGLRHAPPS